VSTDLDDRLSTLFDDLAARVPVEPRPPLDVIAPRAGRPRRGRAVRRLTLQAAALALVAGGSVALVTAARDRDSAPASPATIASSPDTPVDLFDAPPERIEWSVISPDSTIARAQISSVVAGPGGFVAVGLGFDGDLAAGQGRVWFSPDGEGWTEVDRELFGPQQTYAATATGDAYYLYAAPTPPTEGSPGQPSQLYRSPDGTTWEPVGEPVSSPGAIIAIGDTLVRVGLPDGGMLASDDGATWGPVSLDSSGEVLHFDDRAVTAGDTTYLRSWTDDGTWGIWSSTDGRTWSAEPTPATPGRLTGTPTALVSVGDATEGACNAAVDSAGGIDAILAAQWRCAATPTVEALAPRSGEWRPIPAALPIRTPSLPGVTAFGNQLVAAVEGTDGTLSIWLSDDGADWTAAGVEVRTVDGLRPTRSPQAFWVAGQDASTIVIPVSADGVGDLGQLVVGRIVDTR